MIPIVYSGLQNFGEHVWLVPYSPRSSMHEAKGLDGQYGMTYIFLYFLMYLCSCYTILVLNKCLYSLISF